MKGKFKKAWLVIPDWSDEQDVDVWKSQGPNAATYAETGGKAKYAYYSLCEFDDDFYKYHVYRWPEMDLFPAKQTMEALTLSKFLLNKMIHTYGADSDNPGYRNYYYTSHGDHDILRLIAKGLMFKGKSPWNSDSSYFHLTKLGIKTVMSTREILRKDLPKQEGK